MRVAVVGSGLSGLACARALIRRGIMPTMLDAGIVLETPIKTVVDRMSRCSPTEWDSEDVALIRRNPTLHGRGIPRKLVFGSDFIYAGNNPLTRLSGTGIKASMSLAKGGFGNAWGATLLPADPADLVPDWAAPTVRLESNYRAVLSWLPLCAGDDRLQREFPTFCDAPQSLDMPVQVGSLLRDLTTTDDPELSYGLSRLAVHAQGPRACRACGLCLSGCVYGSIFNPADDIEALSRSGSLDYRPGYLVEKVLERAGRVVVIAERLGTREELMFDKVFLASGAISTTRIMLASLEAYDTPVRLVDSQKFLLPLFRREASSYSITDTHSLAALFVEMRVPELGGNWMHMQISAISDFVLRRIGADRSAFIHSIMRPLLERTLVAWCSLHSVHSACLEARLVRDAGSGTLALNQMQVERAQASVRLAMRRMAQAARRFRTLVVPRLVSMSSTGAGNHLGGSFPMRERPSSRFECDLIGRPLGFQNVHLVDAAVMPTVPGTPIALLMMATADRIATEAPIGC